MTDRLRVSTMAGTSEAAATATVGLVTCAQFPDLTPDDRLLAKSLRDRGIDARPVQWDSEGGWDAFDALAIRSTWDYFERPDEFAAWLDERAATGPPLWNPPAVLRWNMQKGYLRDLAAAGIPTVETHWVERGSDAELAQVLAERGWDHAVVKPAISGGAWKTAPVRRADLAEHDAMLRDLIAGHDVMVQPFLTQIVDEGEWSVIFFGGTYSSTLLKRPASGDYRVQERHGGTTEAIAEPPAGLVEQAAAVLPHAPGDLLYARVDGVRDGDEFVLIELEVLEPYLFFGITPGSADRYAEALAARIQRFGAPRG